MKYWNSTGDETRMVDAVILPVAPHAAVIPGKYLHYGMRNISLLQLLRLTVAGYSDFVDLLDFTSVVIPVTKADKNVDRFDKDYKYMNDTDRENWISCK